MLLLILVPYLARRGEAYALTTYTLPDIVRARDGYVRGITTIDVYTT